MNLIIDKSKTQDDYDKPDATAICDLRDSISQTSEYFSDVGKLINEVEKNFAASSAMMASPAKAQCITSGALLVHFGDSP